MSSFAIVNNFKTYIPQTTLSFEVEAALTMADSEGCMEENNATVALLLMPETDDPKPNSTTKSKVILGPDGKPCKACNSLSDLKKSARAFGASSMFGAVAAGAAAKGTRKETDRGFGEEGMQLYYTMLR